MTMMTYLPGTRRSLIAAATFGLIGMAASNVAAQTPAKEWSAVLQGAKTQQRVTWYTVAPQSIIERVVAGFKKAHPDIQVEFLRSASADQLARLEQERKSGADGADIWTTTDGGALSARAKEGVIVKPSGPAAAAFPARYIVDGSVVVTGIEPWVIAYNKTLIKTPIQDYKDLLKPELKGRIGTTEPTGMAFLAFYDFLMKREGPDFIAKLRQQNPKLYNGAVPIGQALASGEIGVGVFNVPSTLKGLMDAGAPIEMVLPKDGMGIYYYTGALSWSKRSDAALVFLDYLMSRDGQTAWHGRGDSASPLADIPGALSAASVTAWDPTKYPPDVATKLRTELTNTLKQ